MKIAIDLRSLQSGSVSGVENYSLNLLEHLLPLDKRNSYALFYNAWQGGRFPELHFVNSKTIWAGWPNKFLNLAFKARVFGVEKFVGDFDCLFMPNLNPINFRKSGKLVITVHDLSPVVVPEFYNFKRRLWHKFLSYKSAFARADLIFAVSEYTKQDLIRLFQVPAQKIRVVYPGIDKKLFHPELKPVQLRQVRNIYGLPGEFLLFLNTIEPRKNLAALIKAFELLESPASLVVAGRRGWKYRKIFQQIERSPKAGKIKYISYVEEEHKPALLKMARALIYPSFYEGFGFQPLEAMAVGTPTVVSQLTALAEVAGEAALLVNPYNVQDMARALELILYNERLREILIAKGLRRAKEFEWDGTAQQILTGLDSLLV